MLSAVVEANIQTCGEKPASCGLGSAVNHKAERNLFGLICAGFLVNTRRTPGQHSWLAHLLLRGSRRCFRYTKCQGNYN